MTSVVHRASVPDWDGRTGTAAPRHNGRHPWGALSVESADPVYGVRYLLLLLPPGTTSEQRRALIFLRQWRTWGAIAAFIIASGLSILINGWIAIVIGAAVYIGTLMLAIPKAGAARNRLLEVHSQVPTGNAASEDCASVETAGARLLALDDLVDAGRLDAVDYELRWGEIYREIASELVVMARRDPSV